MTVVVPAELDDERVDRAVAVLGSMPRSEARARTDAGEVLVDGEPASGKSRVREGMTLSFPPLPAPAAMAPEEVDFGVRYEDDQVVVVDKPSGVTVHPGAGRSTGTLAAGLLARYPDVEGVGEPGRWGLVHRLDRETSGVLLVARTPDAYAVLTAALRRREIGRHYLALVKGTFSLPRGTIDAPIGRDPNRPRRRALVPTGRRAVTHYRMERQWRDVALLGVDLETGRTHQIRVHLAGIDHAVIGDRVYGGRDPVRSPRLFLHAATIRFTHPSGEEMEVSSPLPPDLSAVLEGLGEPVEA